jgi:oxygen-independent coproporphyrinogen III oxidase
MWIYRPDLLQRAVPRYTSYPTAVEFHEGVGAQELDSAITALDDDTAISLYAHIPYCRSICHYCGCNTAAANKVQRLTSYLAALETEIAMIGQKLGGRGRVKHIAFGGGSPNAITPIEFVRLVDRMLTIMPADNPAISVELDPRIFNAEWARILGSCGVTRASLGVQSFAENIQRAIGRIQPFAMVEACVNQLRRNGVEAINFDLIYGLPEQTLADLQETLDLTLKLQPSRIALFGYAHLPNVIPRQRQIDSSTLPDEPARFEMAAVGYAKLVAAGYRAIGFDHFARADDPLAIAAERGTIRRNFQGFTEDANPVLIGMGASAISSFPDMIVQNEKNMGRYGMMMSQPRLAATRGVLRTAEDQVRGALIERLLCTGASGPVPEHMASQAQSALQCYMEQGLVHWVDGGVFLAPDAQPYARVVASVFDQYRQQSTANFSNAI